MKLKRDLTTNAAPAPNQIEVGELAINGNTGILYSKLNDGTVIKWLGVPVCEDENLTVCPVPVPEISFSDVNNFCCGGDGLTVYVSNLLVNHSYSCVITDLIDNSTATVGPASSTLLPLNKSDRYSSFNININQNSQPVSLFKVSIFENVTSNNNTLSMLRSEKVIKICCVNCAST